MRVALVTNAASGSGTDGRRVAALLRDAGARVAVHPFDPDDGDGAIGAAAAAAAAERPDRLAVAGGDGSIGPVAVHAAASGLPLAVIPTGTANDFARALDLPRDLEAACALAVQETHERPIDLLRAGERPFLNAASVGLTARPLRCHVTADGAQVHSGPAWQVIVAGTGAFGGGSELDDADPSDRLVDVAVLEAGPRLALVRRAWGMRGGDLTAQPGVRHARGRVIDLEVPPDTSFNVDGEVCRVAPARFSARGERVRVVCRP